MSDLLERLAAANPVRECEPPSIDDVWRKVSELDASPRAGRPARPRRRSLGGRGVAPALAAVAIPIIVVSAIVIPLLGAHGRSGPAAVGGGGNIWATVDPAAQGLAAQELAGRVGAIVAMDPRTGAVRVLYGNQRTGQPGTAPSAASFLAAAAKAQYPAAGTFDLVSATAALDTGLYTSRSRIAGHSPIVVSGTPLHNAQDQSFGPITLTEALDESVNTVFAQVGEAVGRQTMTAYMERFGFYASPASSPSIGRLPASGVRIHGRLALPNDPRVDLGRLAIGQGGLTVTPLQMAMVAAAIADGGQLMDPHLAGARPTLPRRVMKPATARGLASMMRAVVAQGTGTAAGLKGVQVAGKTGTAQVGAGRSDPWFVGFAPAEHPTVAIAVVLSNVRGGYGGTDAAPIARQVIQKLLATSR